VFQIQEPDARSFSNDKSISFSVEGTAGFLWFMVSRRKRFHGIESADSHWSNSRFRSPGDHNINFASLNRTERIPNRM
jgi:hypothetical protein